MNDINQRKRRRLLAAIAGALACVVVALVVGFALPQLEGVAGSAPDLLQTVDDSGSDSTSATEVVETSPDEGIASQDEAADDTNADAPDEASADQGSSNGEGSGQASNDSQGEGDSSSSSNDSSSKASSNSSKGSNASGSSGGQSQGTGKSDGASSGNKGSNSTGSGSSDVNSSGGSSGEASNTGSQSQEPGSSQNAGQAGSGEQDDSEQTVTIEINTSVLGGGTTTTTVEWSDGMNPYDALVKMGAQVNARDTQFGLYIASINGLAEKEHGGSSGWLYYVNGVKPNYGVSYCTLKSGDVVEWRYTVNGVS